MPEDSDVSAKRARVSSTDSMHANRGGRVADFTFTMMNPRHTPYMDYIRSGKKLAEGRINSGGYSHLVEGKTIYFHNRHEGIICLITFVHRYKSFEALLEAEGIDNMLPQLKHISSSSSKMDEALRIYHSFPGAERVKTFGALAIGVQFLRDHRPGR